MYSLEDSRKIDFTLLTTILITLKLLYYIILY